MPTNDYTFGEDGEVHIGERVLTNVTGVSVTSSGEPGRAERFVAGDSAVDGRDGPDPELTVEVEIEMYDEEGVDADLNYFLKNTATGKGQTIRVRPLGTGAGLKELVLTGKQGMRLINKDRGYPITTDGESATGSMTWRGYFAEEPAETVQ